MKRILTLVTFLFALLLLVSCATDEENVHVLGRRDHILALTGEKGEKSFDLSKVTELFYASEGSRTELHTCKDPASMSALFDAMFCAPISMKRVQGSVTTSDREIDYSFAMEDGRVLRWSICREGELVLFDGEAFYVSEKGSVDYRTIAPHLTWLAVTYRDAAGNRYDLSADGKTFLYYYPTNTEPSFTVPEGVEIVAEGSFANVPNLKELSFASTVTAIYESWYEHGHGIERLVIPASVTNFEHAELEIHLSTLKTLRVECTVQSYHLGGCRNLARMELKNIQSEWTGLMMDACSELVSITIIGAPAIRDEAFEAYCAARNGLPVLYIPEGVEGIGYQLIGNSVNLYLPDSLERIDQYALCPYLEDVIISMPAETVIESTASDDTMYSVSQIIRRD
ncbi:MAG: leucine-rich repeat protein [Clostridia bacterium]|nr:leucine-rich repeat protein [Clostridia bacterium]